MQQLTSETFVTDPYFFGYGSLVNTKSHDYPDARPATLKGWRRAWVATPRSDVVLLTGVRAPGHSIQGLIASVPFSDWTALDAREGGYARIPASEHVDHPLERPADIAVYAVEPHNVVQSTAHVILLSYLDVVVQGFHEAYGAQGVHTFFETTDGWHTPILNDRDDPLYPRHQQLTGKQTQLVDTQLQRLSAQVKQRHKTPLTTKF